MTTNQPRQSPVLTVEEVAAALGIGRSLAYEQLRRGTIPHIRLGAKYVIPRDRFELWRRGEA